MAAHLFRIYIYIYFFFNFLLPLFAVVVVSYSPSSSYCFFLSLSLFGFIYIYIYIGLIAIDPLDWVQRSSVGWGFLLPRTNDRKMKVPHDDPLLTIFHLSPLLFLISFDVPLLLCYNALLKMDVLGCVCCAGTRRRRLR